MKTQVCKRAREAGGVLVLALVTAVLLGLTLSGYLYWVRTQNVLVAESQAWNAALAAAEAGIEDGMAQINSVYGTNYVPSATTNWGSATAGIFGPRTNTLTNGSYSAIIIRTNVYGTNFFPTIISTGYAMVPIIGRPISRTVQVTTTTKAAFGNGMAAIQNITFNGDKISIDSYDSADPLHSTNRMYYAPWRKAGGDVATSSGLVSVGNADVNGKLRTGPGGTFSVGANGFVGDLGFAGPGVQQGWYLDDFNEDYKPVDPPDISGYIGPMSVAGDTNKFILAGGGYIINGDLELKAGETMFVVGGVSTLYVTGDVKMSGGGSAINIAPFSTLKIYVAGASSTFTYVNTTGDAGTFQYYGLPSNTSMTWSGNASYVGTVYAPQATFNCGGGGSTYYDYQGSCVVGSIVLNGHFSFHYDENLARSGPMTGYGVTSWREL